jgi:hypothetical protein
MTEVNTAGLLFLSMEIVKRSLLFVVTKRAEQSIDSPLITAIRAKKIPFPDLFL